MPRHGPTENHLDNVSVKGDRTQFILHKAYANDATNVAEGIQSGFGASTSSRRIKTARAWLIEQWRIVSSSGNSVSVEVELLADNLNGSTGTCELVCSTGGAITSIVGIDAPDTDPATFERDSAALIISTA